VPALLVAAVLLAGARDLAAQAAGGSADDDAGLGSDSYARSLDRQALQDLYWSTGGPGWADSTNWLSDKPVAEWHGVRADRDGVVVSLDLSGNGLQGTLPSLLHQMPRLRYLDLGDNRLSGPIPSELGASGSLRALYLDNTALSGEIPGSLAELSTLRALSARGTHVRSPGDPAFQAWLGTIAYGGSASVSSP